MLGEMLMFPVLENQKDVTFPNKTFNMHEFLHILTAYCCISVS